MQKVGTIIAVLVVGVVAGGVSGVGPSRPRLDVKAFLDHLLVLFGQY